MPQFEQIETFAGQVFWLIVFFSLLYYLMAKIVLPRIADILETRQRQIEGDIQSARDHHDEAEKILTKLNHEIARTKDEARKIISDAELSIQENIANKTKSLEAELEQQVKQAEDAIGLALEQARIELKDHAKELASMIVTDISGKAPSAAKLNAGLKESIH